MLMRTAPANYAGASVLNALVYPTDACNLRCSYCFHAKSSYPTQRMPIPTLRRFFDLASAHYEELHIIWHGGEPLVAGLDFFSDALTLEEEFESSKRLKFTNELMTNGTLIDSEWCSFFREKGISVGVSHDGIDNESVRGHTVEVERGMTMLREWDVPLNVVSVVTAQNLDSLVKNYEYLKHFTNDIKFNPVTPIGGGRDSRYQLNNPSTFASSMSLLFKHWAADSSSKVVLNPFYLYVLDYLTGTGSLCMRSSCLGRWLALKPNGCFYPCVRENRPEFCFGHIDDIEDLGELFESYAFIELLSGSINRRDKCRQSCELYSYCEGGCCISALRENGLNNPGGFSCAAFKICFAQVADFINLFKEHSSRQYTDLNPALSELLQEFNA